MNWKQQAIIELAQKIKAAGYRVFISKTGEYGLFTNAEGSRIVGFGFDYSQIYFSGWYAPSHTNGSGWRIGTVHDIGNFNVDSIFNACPPSWIVFKGSEPYRPTTLAQHFKHYQNSSQYVEQ